MLNVKCRKCGKRYDDFEFDCCPRCGTYNRAPRRDDLGDAGGAARRPVADESAQQEPKGSAEETEELVAQLERELAELTEGEHRKPKAIYDLEDEARASSSRQNAVETEESKGDRRKNAIIGIVMACIIILGTVIMAVRPAMIGEKQRWSADSGSMSEQAQHSASAAEEEPELQLPQIITAQEVEELRLLEWQKTDHAIELTLYAYPGSLVPVLQCVDADGKEIMLEKYERTDPQEFPFFPVFRFFTEDGNLTPRAFILKGFDEKTREYAVFYQFNLGSDTGSAQGRQTSAETKEGETVRLPQIYTAQEASELGLLEWQRTDQGIKLTLYADAESLFPELECVDAAGNEVILEDCTRSPYYPVVFRFFTEDENLTPRAFVLNGFDDETKETVTYYRFYLEPEQ